MDFIESVMILCWKCSGVRRPLNFCPTLHFSNVFDNRTHVYFWGRPINILGHML